MPNAENGLINELLELTVTTDNYLIHNRRNKISICCTKLGMSSVPLPVVCALVCVLNASTIVQIICRISVREGNET